MNSHTTNSKTFGKLHNWTHISCFWQLPYFHKLLLPHNIDVMHNEKNVAEAIWNTCFDIPDKTKDNAKARQDLAEICNRPSLHLVLKKNGKWHKPRAPFCIEKNDKTIILKWFQELKFPDGYAANIRRGVNLSQRKIFGLKNHDYHIFMERLLPVAFRGFLPEETWVCLAELSFFYRQLCAKELRKDTICNLEEQIVVLLCKMEKIFPPGFFNPMQHLIIHLPREARLGGPVQARWNYPYERKIQRLRKKVRNKARVEGCIVEAELVEEATNYLSLYFKPTARSIRNKIPRYDDGACTFESSCNIEIFKYPGRCTSPRGIRSLSLEEYEAAFLYILTNMLEMDGLFKKFDEKHWKSRIKPKPEQLRDLRLNGWKTSRGKHGPDFFDWFKECMVTSSIDIALHQISYGFRQRVSSYGCYDVNGYRFRSEEYERTRFGLTTVNTGVCVCCIDENDNELEYYGVIKDIIKIKWEGNLQLEIVLFDCQWFDPTVRGTRRTENLGLVEIKCTSRLSVFEPFVMASQVKQVYYVPYACKNRSDLADWWVAYQVSPRGCVPPQDNNDDSNSPDGTNEEVLIYQEDGLEGTFVII
ncbi:uncharacterized protein LOC102709376 isoform X2 [Oryza brachyantha]|uniref:uncharacterized protein LOC102709376 isoform X2 n=1 Tax=Oryza brachyantha TaxID=4533 RepID=UPI001AD97688|nr:uncharacterized protein LOC102709376 isoform X2 [Oryza brachyantha]